MCGILSLFNKNSFIDSKTKSSFLKGLEELKHRGPDETKIYIDQKCLIGFNRLSIVGGNLGTQPISNEQYNLYLVCNGEIYNNKELRQKLQKRHIFKTASDCEIIIHLYEEVGVDAFKLLKGQFALCIYDKKNGKLVCARDRFGIQPLFFVNNNKKLAVSSEIKGLLKICPEISRLDITALAEGIMFYGPTPPRSYFQNVKQIPPGNFVIFDLKTNKTEYVPYWTPKIDIQQFDQGKFEALIDQAIRRRLMGTSKNVGVYLSGGIDSSAVALLTKHYSKQPPLLFSVKFNKKMYDESFKQNLVSEALNLQNYAVTGDSPKVVNVFNKVIKHIEAPLTRTAPIPLFLLSSITRNKDVKYVLCGEGADELLLGYPVFQQNISSIESKFQDQKIFERLFLVNNKINFVKMMSHYLNQIKDRYKVNNKIVLSQLIEIDTKLSRYLLSSQGDRMSMSHSVEQRFPFLDEDLVDYTLATSPMHKIKEGVGKFPLRSYMIGKLPAEIIWGKKQGYLAPWELLDLIINKHKNLITNPDVYKDCGYFNQKEVKKVFSDYIHGNKSESIFSQLLFVISTHQLHNIFFKKMI